MTASWPSHPGMVRELVDSQFPDWRDLAVTAVDSSGTVNAIFRVGAWLAPVPAGAGRRRRGAARA